MENAYEHKVQYYETDAMQIVHHSNYIRWFEEARIAYLAQAGFDYERIEARGLLIPVLSVNCEYKQSVKFGETVLIDVKIKSFNGLKFQIEYEVYSQDRGTLHATGTTTHCFLNSDFQPVRLKKEAPDIYEYFMKSVA